jgi:aminoglycoside phosphotransferase (APT) family kinase protein
LNESIVATAAEAAGLEFGAALVLDPLREFLDASGIGSGDLHAAEFVQGHSNLTFLLRRGRERFVLRRPPRGDLSRSANDVLRESRILEALSGTDVPVPRVLARCEDEVLIGAPFFVMSFVPGIPVNDGLPEELDCEDPGARIVEDLVAALTEIHGADLERTGLGDFGRRFGYLERQLRRFNSLHEENATRPLPALEQVGEWLVTNLPSSEEATFVHGDYRLGNLLFTARLHLAAVLDWEMATVGDPLADLGYLTATWAEPGEEPNPMFALSRVTTQPGFPPRDEIVARYQDLTGRSVDDLLWYQVLALWKSAIFLEGSYRRHRAGASTDAYFAALDKGVPALGRAALVKIEQG